MRRSRLLSVLAAGTLAVIPVTGVSSAGPLENRRSIVPVPAVSHGEVQDDSDGDERMRASCEQMHQEMMRGMDENMGRMHDDMTGGTGGMGRTPTS